MSVPIRTLKRRYKVSLSMGRALPLFDLSVPLPLSTGNPLYDAALGGKLVPTQTMSEAQHLKRCWELIRSASPDELAVLARHAAALMNDQKLLLALHCWNEGNAELAGTFLGALPWAWRLSFPTAVIKPAAAIFTGWKRDLRFRLIENLRFEGLYDLFRETLLQAPVVVLLKYRRAVKQSAALLHYRFEGERERALHDWCFGRGESLADTDLEPLSTYARARTALHRGDVSAFLNVLEKSPQTIPLTSYIGLLGHQGIRLSKKKGQPNVGRLRDYAVRCATPVEMLLHLAQWSSWLQTEQVSAMAARVREALESGRVSIPFHRVTRAFLAAPDETRKMILEPLYLPLLADFGRQAARVLPPPGPVTWLQPGNLLNMTSFLLFACLASACDTRLLLAYKDGVEEVSHLDLNRLGPHLADEPHELERWLLAEFGGLASQRYGYEYSYPAIARQLRTLSPQAPLVMDVPYGGDEELLNALLPFERVFNLNGAVGAPGELSLSPGYYAASIWTGRGSSRAAWRLWSNQSAVFFAELVERVVHFQSLAAEQGAEDLL
jgi:hypothetical protein